MLGNVGFILVATSATKTRILLLRKRGKWVPENNEKSWAHISRLAAVAVSIFMTQGLLYFLLFGYSFPQTYSYYKKLKVP